jgi:arylsulfatase A-like enzyme
MHHYRSDLRSGWIRATLVACICVGLAIVAVEVFKDADVTHPATNGGGGGGPSVQPVGPVSSKPNIVFVLTDDLSTDLVPYMPSVLKMQQDGLSFNDYFVSDSLCCPSRSSIFTGNLPHDTGVFGNSGPHGGFNVFHNRGEEHDTFATALQHSGYRTAMMGKYLNGYLGPSSDVAPTYVPPGWSDWQVVGEGYREFNYTLNDNGTLEFYGNQPDDYLTDVLARKGVQFVDRSTASGKPFFLELATFAPHRPFVPAPRYRHMFKGLTSPRGPNFDVLPTNPPSWLAGHPPLNAHQLHRINGVFRRRVEDVQSIDDMINSIESTLTADGVANNTYIVFSSDNGLHMGQWRLAPGKLTAFDTDIRVPLVVVGPGVPAGAQSDAMSENIDLAKTFTSIGGTSLDGDGHSLLNLWHGQTPIDWRNAVLIEHHGPDLAQNDPDRQSYASGNPLTYEAMRTHGFLYVEYHDGELEYYDLRTDPFELHNIAGSLSPTYLALLHATLLAMENCHGGVGCWAAMHLAAFNGDRLRRHHLVAVSGASDRRRRHRRRHHRRHHRHRRRHHLG